MFTTYCPKTLLYWMKKERVKNKTQHSSFGIHCSITICNMHIHIDVYKFVGSFARIYRLNFLSKTSVLFFRHILKICIRSFCHPWLFVCMQVCAQYQWWILSCFFFCFCFLLFSFSSKAKRYQQNTPEKKLSF